MADRAAKNALYDGFAVVGRALSSGRRTEIIDVLAQGERSVDEIAGEIDQSIANTSQHLQQLLRSGLVVSRREGNRVYYSLTSSRVSDLWAALRDVASAHVAGVEELEQTRDTLVAQLSEARRAAERRAGEEARRRAGAGSGREAGEAGPLARAMGWWRQIR